MLDKMEYQEALKTTKDERVEVFSVKERGDLSGSGVGRERVRLSRYPLDASQAFRRATAAGLPGLARFSRLPLVGQ